MATLAEASGCTRGVRAPEWGSPRATGHNGPVSDAPSTPPTGRVQYPRWLWAVGFVVVAIIAAAVAGLAAVGNQDSTTLDSSAIEQLVPPVNAKILQQAPVGVDLAPGYEGKLIVNGIPIPEAQTDVTKGLNLIQFQPGPGKVIEHLNAGQNCMIATYWRSSIGPSDATSRSWCFTVV